MPMEIKAESVTREPTRRTLIEGNAVLKTSVSSTFGETIAEMMTDKANIELESPRRDHA